MGARPLFFKPLTGEIKTMKIFTNHRYALITGIVLAVVLSVVLHRALVPDAEFNHLSLARWVHIVAGVFWIGLLYYLNAVQVPALAAAAEDKGGPGPRRHRQVRRAARAVLVPLVRARHLARGRLAARRALRAGIHASATRTARTTTRPS